MHTLLLGEKNADICLIQAVDDHDAALLDAEYALIRQKVPDVAVALFAFQAADWNGDLSPWPALPVFGNEPFAGRAEDTLADLLQQGLPEARKALRPGKEHFILGGYSLAGLFALWAACRTPIFEGCAAASPSVWFPGWVSFAETHPMQSSAVYLSLGDREEKTRNPVMAAVGDCIRRQSAILDEIPACRHTLQWNPGNHFRDPEKRTADAFAWCVSALLARDRKDEYP